MHRNLILRALSEPDRAALEGELSDITYESGRELFEKGDQVDNVVFPETAVISLVVPMANGENVEAAMIGADGVVGAASALDGRRAVSRTVVQIAGSAKVCSAAYFKRVAMQSATLLSQVFSNEQGAFAQAQQSAACNASHSVDARLARWLLRARDLSSSDTLNFTHEFLAQMLGTRRASVSVVAHTLQQAGMIEYRRGRIRIRNLEGLQETACECYQAVKSVYDESDRPRLWQDPAKAGVSFSD